jgi:hypothetical protein
MRLINADELHEVVYKEGQFYIDPETNDCVRKLTIRISDVLRIIDDAPTVPCRIAVGASWLDDDDRFVTHRVHCSICGYDVDAKLKTNYCPACGSRMDGIRPEWEVKLP